MSSSGGGRGVCLPFDTSYSGGGGLQAAGARTGNCSTFGTITAVMAGGETLQIFFASTFSISSRRNFRLLLFSDGLELRLRLWLRSGLEHGLEHGLLSGVKLSVLMVPDCRPTIVRIKPYRFLLITKSNAPTFGLNEYRDDFSPDADDIML